MKIVLCILAAWSLAAAADNKPNFSGEWKMNLAQGVLGPIPAPASLTRRIVHSEPSLIITEDQKGGSGDHVFTRHYTTDGKQVAFLENGANITARARWEGAALLIASEADAGGTTVAFVERMTLSNAGKTLTDFLHIVTPQGEIDATYSFEKQ
jgi:hypothetical protein